MENDPSPQDYRLRELYPKYYMLLAALAAVAMSPPGEWQATYEERLDEIKQEILANGGVIHD